MPIGTGGALLAGGALSGLASLFGASTGAAASTKAAQLQADAANRAIQLQGNIFGSVQGMEAPFFQGGADAFTTLLAQTGARGDPSTAPLTAALPGFSPTLSQLEQFPGYQFILDQGLKATQNSYAAQGLGASGAAMKGAAQYAEGLAGTTEQQFFNQFLQGQQLTLAQRQQAIGALTGAAGIGQSAASLTGNAGVTSGQGIAGSIAAGGAAGAAGTIGSANALIGGASGIAGAGQNTALLLALQNAGLFGSPSTSTTGSPTGGLYG